MLGLGYLAAYLEKYLDFTGTEIVTSGEADEIIARKPDIVGISSVTENFDQAVEMAERIRKPPGPGPYRGASYHQPPTNAAGLFRSGCARRRRGNPGRSPADLWSRGRFSAEVLEAISGIAFRVGGGHSRYRAATVDLTPRRIPHPDWKRLGLAAGDFHLHVHFPRVSLSLRFLFFHPLLATF